jgi:GNAT superfamily N-acetyltransferase
MPRTDIEIRSLLTATDIDVLPDSSIVEDHGEYVVVRTPTNPTFHWGNFLMFRRPPAQGDRERWEATFDEHFAAEGGYRHCALCWDVPGEVGAAQSEFIDQGYDADYAVALVADPHELVEHLRSNRSATVRALDPDADAESWQSVLALQVATREKEFTEEDYWSFVTSRMADRTTRFRAGDGAWFVAEDESGTIVASCGVVVTHGRARFQSVDTHPDHRRRGYATRVVHDAGRAALDRFGAEHLVIAADADYHALPLYQSLGFSERERCLAVCWWPGAEHAALHPDWSAKARSTLG